MYVIELRPDVIERKTVAGENAERREDKPCLYVGQTARTPEERFAQHLAGVRSSRIVQGVRRAAAAEAVRQRRPVRDASRIRTGRDEARGEAAPPRLRRLEQLMRCVFCRTDLDTVHWAFDGVSDQPVPACRECCDRLRLKVWRVEAGEGEGKDLPVRADCVYCGTPLPSQDTRPVIVWVRGEHGVEAVCNACRIRYGRETQFVTLPHADWDETDWPRDNATLLRQLFAEGVIDLQRGALFDSVPPDMPASFDWDRVDGMLLGLAIGDALGNTSEGMLPARRRELYGEIRDYVPHWRRKTLATPTDDTQLAFWTLDQLLADDGLNPGHLARRFSSERIFGIGQAVSQAMEAVRLGYRPWYECGTRSAGNGALMRIAPMLVPYVRSPSPDLWVDTALSAIVTHNDAASTSACLAFVAMLWQLLAHGRAARTFVVAARVRPPGARPRGRDGVRAAWRRVPEPTVGRCGASSTSGSPPPRPPA